MVVGVEHTSFEEQQDFLLLPPAQQALKIYMNGNETNGKVAEALRRIGKLEQGQVAHDGRLVKLENWQIKAAAVLAAAMFIGPAVFFALAQIWR